MSLEGSALIPLSWACWDVGFLSPSAPAPVLPPHSATPSSHKSPHRALGLPGLQNRKEYTQLLFSINHPAFGISLQQQKMVSGHLQGLPKGEERD